MDPREEEIILGFHSSDENGHVGVQNNGKVSLKFCIIIESNSQNTFFTIVLYTNVAAVTSRENRELWYFCFSDEGDKEEKTTEAVSTVTAEEVPDVPNNSFLFRRSRTPSPVREKRLQEEKNRFVSPGQIPAYISII